MPKEIFRGYIQNDDESELQVPMPMSVDERSESLGSRVSQSDDESHSFAGSSSEMSDDSDDLEAMKKKTIRIYDAKYKFKSSAQEQAILKKYSSKDLNEKVSKVAQR